jgi:magnesium chelatase accessory protein
LGPSDPDGEGRAPTILLLHGTGAATHSWRDLMPRLARHAHVIALDLPGHGFTSRPSGDGLSLPGMARLIAGLLDTLAIRPDIVIGHSAGAAIALRMALDGGIAPRLVVGLNAALLPFKGMAGQVFPFLAKTLVLNPFVPRFVAWSAARRDGVERLIGDTGSTIDDAGLGLYHRLFQSSAHVGATLGMMANWDLKPLLDDLPRLPCALALIVGAGDRAVPPSDAYEVRRRLPAARIQTIPDHGHLVHEEVPDQVAAMIETLARDAGLMGAEPAAPAAPAAAREALPVD